MLFTVDRLGNTGHPTRRFDQIRKLRKRGLVRIIGGGLSGKPATVQFLSKTFDVEKTVDRKFARVIDPGYNTIGYAVCEVVDESLIVLCRGHLETRISGIKELMQDRKMHRRARRTIARYKMRRLSALQGRVLTKFKKPRNIRSEEKTSATLLHGVDTHLNMFGLMYKFCPLPVYQTVQVMEDNVFDVRFKTWGPVKGKDYLISPRKEVPEKKCILCGATTQLQSHHLIQRKQGGTEVNENKIYLCHPTPGTGCHTDVHAGRMYLPIMGVKQNRALGTMNAIAGMLRTCKGILRVSASGMAEKRRELGIDKEHANDAVCAVAALFDCASVNFSQETYVPLQKFRRHNRPRIHAVRERSYVIEGKIVAQNRNKRCDQKTDSLAELRASNPSVLSSVTVRPGVKLYNPERHSVPTIGGDVWVHIKTGKRFVATGVQNSGKYLYSPGLKSIIGKAYVSPSLCRRMIRNNGVAASL